MAFSSFWHWWRDGMAHFVPRGLRAGGAGNKDRVLVRVSDTDLWVVPPGTAGTDRASSVPVASRRDIDQWLARVRIRSPRWLIELPRREVLVRTMNLPDLSDRDIRAVLEHEIERQTPFELDAVYFDCLHLPATSGEPAMQALVVVRRGYLDALVARVAQLGLGRPRFVIEGFESAMPGLHFGFDARGTEAGALSGRRLVIGAVALSAVVVALYALLLAELESRREQAAGALAEARAAAAEAVPLRQRIRDLSAALPSGDEVSRAYTEPLAILAELTAILPDDCWLEALELNGDGVRIKGHAADASRLIALLQDSHLLGNVRFTAPLSNDPGTGRDRFAIAMDIEEQPL